MSKVSPKIVIEPLKSLQWTKNSPWWEGAVGQVFILDWNSKWETEDKSFDNKEMSAWRLWFISRVNVVRSFDKDMTTTTMMMTIAETRWCVSKTAICGV